MPGNDSQTRRLYTAIRALEAIAGGVEEPEKLAAQALDIIAAQTGSPEHQQRAASARLKLAKAPVR